MTRSSLKNSSGFPLSKGTRAQIFRDIRKVNPNSIVKALVTKVDLFFANKPGKVVALHVAYEATVMIPTDGENPTLEAMTTRDSVAYVISE